MCNENWGNGERCIFCQVEHSPNQINLYGVPFEQPNTTCKFYPPELTGSIVMECSPECAYYLSETAGFNILRGVVSGGVVEESEQICLAPHFGYILFSCNKEIERIELEYTTDILQFDLCVSQSVIDGRCCYEIYYSKEIFDPKISKEGSRPDWTDHVRRCSDDWTTRVRSRPRNRKDPADASFC